MRERPIALSALAGTLVLAVLMLAVTAASAGTDSTIQLVALDADPSGNTATSLGHLDPCVRVEPGADVTIDLVVDAVPDDRPVIGFQISVVYDPTVLEVIAVENDLFLAANGTFSPFDVSDSLPDRDGDMAIVIADFASDVAIGANMETGEGVLARITFKAIGSGMSDMAVGAPPESYPILLDDQNTAIEVRAIAGIKVAVDGDCPPGLTEIEPTPLPSLPSIPIPTRPPSPTGHATPDPTPVPSNSSIQIIAMDADSTGNTATTLGHLDPCVRAEPGSDVTVDLVVDAVPGDRPVIAFEVVIDYDPAILELVAIDHNFLLGSEGYFQPFDGLSDPLPDSDGSFAILIADLASNEPAGANMESGPGVLSRVTFATKAEGSSLVAPGFDPPEVYPGLSDWANTTIEVRTIAGIRVAVGEDCPPGLTEIQPTPLPSLPELEGWQSPTAAPSPTSAPSPTPTVSPAVLPVAFPATGGTASGGVGTLWVVVAAAVAVAAGVLGASRIRCAR